MGKTQVRQEREDRQVRQERQDRKDRQYSYFRQDRQYSTDMADRTDKTRSSKHLNVSLTIYVGQFYSEKDFVNIKSESVLVLFQLLNIGSIGLEPLHALMFGRQDTWGARDL